MSHARRHFQQASATALGGGDEAAVSASAASAYELQLRSLAEDRRQLSGIQSKEGKIELKRTLLPKYLPWVEGVIAGNSGRQDNVLVTICVWAIDTGDFDLALRLADYALVHKLAMPDQFNRTLPCAMAEEIADQTLKAMAAEQIVAPDILEQALALTADEDMHDQVRAKLYKAFGYALRDAERLEEAKAALVRALELHDKVGVKKDIERLETLLKNSPPSEAAGSTGGSEGG